MLLIYVQAFIPASNANLPMYMVPPPPQMIPVMPSPYLPYGAPMYPYDIIMMLNCPIIVRLLHRNFLPLHRTSYSLFSLILQRIDTQLEKLRLHDVSDSSSISFYLNGKQITVTNPDPTMRYFMLYH